MASRKQARPRRRSVDEPDGVDSLPSVGAPAGRRPVDDGSLKSSFPASAEPSGVPSGLGSVLPTEPVLSDASVEIRADSSAPGPTQFPDLSSPSLHFSVLLLVVVALGGPGSLWRMRIVLLPITLIAALTSVTLGSTLGMAAAVVILFVAAGLGRTRQQRRLASLRKIQQELDEQAAGSPGAICIALLECAAAVADANDSGLASSPGLPRVLQSIRLAWTRILRTHLAAPYADPGRDAADPTLPSAEVARAVLLALQDALAECVHMPTSNDEGTIRGVFAALDEAASIGRCSYCARRATAAHPTAELLEGLRAELSDAIRVVEGRLEEAATRLLELESADERTEASDAVASTCTALRVAYKDRYLRGGLPRVVMSRCFDGLVGAWHGMQQGDVRTPPPRFERIWSAFRDTAQRLFKPPGATIEPSALQKAFYIFRKRENHRALQQRLDAATASAETASRRLVEADATVLQTPGHPLLASVEATDEALRCVGELYEALRVVDAGDVEEGYVEFPALAAVAVGSLIKPQLVLRAEEALITLNAAIERSRQMRHVAQQQQQLLLQGHSGDLLVLTDVGSEGKVEPDYIDDARSALSAASQVGSGALASRTSRPTTISTTVRSDATAIQVAGDRNGLAGALAVHAQLVAGHLSARLAPSFEAARCVRPCRSPRNPQVFVL